MQHVFQITGKSPTAFIGAQCWKTFQVSHVWKDFQSVYVFKETQQSSHWGKGLSNVLSVKNRLRVPMNWEDMVRHGVDIHSSKRPQKCRHCDMAFVGLAHLRGQERVHIGEQPHKCSQCEQSFSSPRDLKGHERIHAGEKPYEWWLCGKVLISATLLRHHTQDGYQKLTIWLKHCRKHKKTCFNTLNPFPPRACGWQFLNYGVKTQVTQA